MTHLKKKNSILFVTFMVALALIIPLMIGLAGRSQNTDALPSSSHSADSTQQQIDPVSSEEIPPDDSFPVDPIETPAAKPTPKSPTEGFSVNTDIDLSVIAALDGTSRQWGPGTIKDEDNRSVSCISLQQEYGKYDALFIEPTDNAVIYLTFDEGYENGYTAAILDTLKEKNAVGVFFVTLPYVRSNPDLVQRMIKEGHVVGNHSNKHKNFTKLSLEESKQDILDLHQYMLENFDYTMKLFRFPEGAFSQQTVALLQAMGYRSCFWSFAYADWDPENQMEEESAYDKATAALCSGNIYLLHAVSKTNANILGRFIDAAVDAGYPIGDPVNLFS